MRNLILLIPAILFPVLLSAQQEDCREKPADLDSKAALQVDTTIVVDPETYEQTKRLTRIYHQEEMAIVDRKTVGNKTYHYVKKDNCLVIRHVTETID